MRGEGTLTIRADNVTITEAYADDTTGLLLVAKDDQSSA